MTELSKSTADDVQGEILCLQEMFPNYAGIPEEDTSKIYKATSDTDTMYIYEAMKEPYAFKFCKAIQEEWEDQIENRNFTVMRKSGIPQDATVLPAVWHMRRKRYINTRQNKR